MFLDGGLYTYLTHRLGRKDGLFSICIQYKYVKTRQKNNALTNFSIYTFLKVGHLPLPSNFV